MKKIVELNDKGIHCIFAPNHLEPQGKLAFLRKQSALADDFPILKSVLRQHGIDTSVLFRGDGDIPFGSVPVLKNIMEGAYDLHRKLFSLFGRGITGGIPLNINVKQPAEASQRNIAPLRETLATLKQKNLAVYPYGNWFKAGEQTFDERKDLHEGGSFVGKEDFERWRVSLKKGFIRLARKTASPIIPVHVDFREGTWILRFGEPIIPTEEQTDIDVAKLYLRAMRTLKEGKEK